MSKLLVVEESIILQSVFRELLDSNPNFTYDLVSSYAEANMLLSKSRYEFGIVDRVLSDAPNGEIIALLNKYNIAPLVYTKYVDEDFFESFESAQIVDYILKQKYDKVTTVIKKLEKLQENKKITILVATESKIYNSYLKQNLNIHNFKVFTSSSFVETQERIDLHPETSLLIVDINDKTIDSTKIVEYLRMHSANKHTKVLLIVDEANSYKTSSLLNLGANDFIVKQFSRDEFYVRVYQNINKVC